MASAASIPESQGSETSGSQLSSDAKTMNSKAQSSSESSSESSTESQKTRAAAHSKLMQEAKRIGEDLKALRSEFNDMADLFSINTWTNNKAVFAKWRLVIATVHNCTGWDPIERGYMNLQLQNPPGQDGMFQVVPRMVFITQCYSNGFLQRTLREIHKGSQAGAE